MADENVPARGDETTQLIARARNGDESCLTQLRNLIADESAGQILIDTYGSPAQWLEGDLMEQVSGKNLLIREASKAKLASLRSELSGPDPTPIERLLAERAAVCWFLVNRYESNYARAKDLSLRQASYHQERIDRAHRRFMSALKTLATVRKLALPAIQVNIARNQVDQMPRAIS